MKQITFFIFTFLFLITSCHQEQKKDNSTATRPNIIYILADDLGYGELGCYGQEKIETPNIDKLAETGMRFTDHYAASPVCAPSRCGLLTGLHPGHAFVRGNYEWKERGDVWSYKAMIRNSGKKEPRWD